MVLLTLIAFSGGEKVSRDRCGLLTAFDGGGGGGGVGG